MRWREAAMAAAFWAAPFLAQAEAGTVAAPGRIEPESEEIFVAAAATGVIAELLVQEGDKIDKGQHLARLLDAQARARVAQAKAAVALAEAQREKIHNGALPAERAEAAAAVNEATAVQDQARKEIQRVRDLLTKGWATPQAVERAERDHGVAVARLATAKQRHATVDRPPRADDLAAADASVAQAQGKLAEADAALADLVVRSPVTGTVLRVFRRAGELVSESRDMPVLAVGDTRVLRVRAEVDEADIGRLRIGQTAHVRADAFGDRRFPGKVVRLGERMGRKTIRTDNPAERTDTQVLEVLIDLADCPPMPVGLRVDTFIAVE